MAKSRKTPPRKKTGAKPSKTEVLDAEVVLPDTEPQDLEVDDTPLTEPASLKDAGEIEAAADRGKAAGSDAIGDAKEAVSDTVDSAKDAVDGAKDAVSDKVDDAVAAAEAKVDDLKSHAGDAAMEDAAKDARSENSDPVPDERPAPVAAEPAPASSGGMFGSIMGGVIAGAIGFGIAMLIFPEGWREKDDSLVTSLQEGVTSLQDGLGEQVEKVTALTGQVGDLDGKLGELGGQISGLTQSMTEGLAERGTEIAAVADRLQRLTEGEGMVALPDDVQLLLNAQKERIEELSSNVAGIAENAQDQINGLSQEVAGMAASAKAQMEAALAEQETAQEAEARVKARGALQAVRLALVSGEPFADALGDIAPATEVPKALSAVADSGVPTMAGLVGDYPGLARSALSVAAREAAPETTGNKLGNFFKDQLNARSLTPQEGDSADAVLSRVEAAVKSEDLETALSEIASLPDASKEVFADWTAQAEARQGAVNGYEAVSDALNGN